MMPFPARLVALLWVVMALTLGTPSLAAPDAAPFTLILKNGGMTQIGPAGAPAEWGGKSGDADTARDTDVYKVGPASLRVSATAGKGSQGFQTVPGGAGATFTLAGWFKTAGSARAQVFVQAFADGYKQNQFIQIQYRQGASDWGEFSKQVTLPPWTAFFTVGVLIEGDGKAWLDEVHEASAPVNGGQALSEDKLLTGGPPAKDRPDVPGWGFYPQFPSAWLNFHHGFLDRTKQDNVSIVFLGDSITQGWTGGGKEIWDRRYAPLGAVDYGIGGDSTRQVLWRIGHGELDGLSPKLVMLLIGTNNLYGDFNAGTDDEIAAGITKIVATLRTKLPRTKILLLGLLPRQNEYFSGRIVTINKAVAKLEDGHAVRFLDMGPKFATALGKVRPELYSPDQLHLNAAGYQAWADAMQPLFDALLRAPLGTHPIASSQVTSHRPSPKGRARSNTHTRASSSSRFGRSTRALRVASASAGEVGSEHWQALAMERPDLLAEGITPGGEGCQYPQTIAIDSTDGRFLLYGTDVGGIFRSTDGGRTFSPCDMGYSAIGSCGFAIDPKNPHRCLSVGDNSGQDGNVYYIYDGVYLSTDQGASWKQVLPKLNRGSEKAREQIAYDPSSFDAGLGYCTVAYWAEEGNQSEPGGRLYKTTDGGATWAHVADGAAYGGGHRSSLLKINPKSGAIYIANDSGFYKSTDGGKTFTRNSTGNFSSLDMAGPSGVLVATEDTLSLSRDAGETFAPVPHTGISAFYRVKVSPADPRRLVCQNPQDNGERYFSADGGRTWTRSGKDMTQSWIPPDILYNDRSRLVVWHPTDPSLAWGIGPGDIITRTTDGGKTFRWGNNGNNGIMTGGLFNFNAQNPDVLYFGSQDYNGALTVNRGKTWRFINLSKDNKNSKRGDDGDPWGWVYGGYAASPLILYGGNRAYTEENYNLWITFDGGKTTMQKAVGLQGAQVSLGDPTDPNVLFCWNQRSADRGQTWAPMAGCDGVFTASPTGDRALYGRHDRALVRSRDKGATWQVLATLPADIRDVGYDPRRDRVYAAAGDNALYECDGPAYAPVNIHDRLPRDQHGDGFMTSTVAVDPVDPSVVYAGANGTGLFFQRSAGVARSTDGGLTWERLTQNPAYCANGITGGEMASALRVHPVTRELFVGTDCYGTWKIGPPAGAKARAVSAK